MWMIVSFIVVYGAMCLAAIPDGRRSERQYTKLHPLASAILFLPLHLGKLTAYSIPVTILQAGNYALHLVMLLMMLTNTSAEVFKSIVGLCFTGIVLVAMVVAIIRENK